MLSIFLFPENQQTIHLECEGLAPGVAADHWWGLEFYNSTHYIYDDPNGAIRINESASILEHVEINFAGVDKVNNSIFMSYDSIDKPFNFIYRDLSEFCYSVPRDS